MTIKLGLEQTIATCFNSEKAVVLISTPISASETHRVTTISPLAADLGSYPWRRMVSAAMICGFLVRLIVVLAQYKAIAAPTYNHGKFGAEMGWVARSLALHQGFSSPFLPSTGPTPLMPPLFPYLLSLIFRLTGLYTLASALLTLLMQSLCSVFTCVPVFLIARRLHTVRAGMWAVWVWEFYPYAVYYSAGEVWDYSVTALLFSCSLALLLQLHHDSPARLWRNAGLLIGVAALSNPSILPAVLFLATIAVRFHRNLLQTHLLKLSILLGAVLVVLLP